MKAFICFSIFMNLILSSGTILAASYEPAVKRPVSWQQQAKEFWKGMGHFFGFDKLRREPTTHKGNIIPIRLYSPIKKISFKDWSESVQNKLSDFQTKNNDQKRDLDRKISDLQDQGREDRRDQLDRLSELNKKQKDLVAQAKIRQRR